MQVCKLLAEPLVIVVCDAIYEDCIPVALHKLLVSAFSASIIKRVECSVKDVAFSLKKKKRREVYLASVEGKIYIFSANKEATLINTIDTGEHTFATPAFTDGKMIIRTNESIYCVAAK